MPFCVRPIWQHSSELGYCRKPEEVFFFLKLKRSSLSVTLSAPKSGHLLPDDSFMVFRWHMEADVLIFRRRWPCSEIWQGPGSFIPKDCVSHNQPWSSFSTPSSCQIAPLSNTASLVLPLEIQSLCNVFKILLALFSCHFANLHEFFPCSYWEVAPFALESSCSFPCGFPLPIFSTHPGDI